MTFGFRPRIVIDEREGLRRGDRVRIAPSPYGHLTRSDTGTVKGFASYNKSVASVLVDGNRGAAYLELSRLTKLVEEPAR